jgi:hypothetical protein
VNAISDPPVKICDPWQALQLSNMMKEIPITQCSSCLPDCSTTEFEKKVTAVPFGKYDYTNIGINDFRNFNKKDNRPLSHKTFLSAIYLSSY